MKLYHGTTNENILDIQTNGLIPSFGDLSKMKYDSSDNLVFACNKEHLSKAISAIVVQIASKLNLKHWNRVDDNMILEHGVLFEITETSTFNFKAENSENHPTNVENNDFYSYKTITVNNSITGIELLNIAKDNGYQYHEPKTGGFGGL